MSHLNLVKCLGMWVVSSPLLHSNHRRSNSSSSFSSSFFDAPTHTTGYACVAMELGSPSTTVSLTNFLEHSPHLLNSRIIEILIEVAAGLQYLREFHGVVHMDIKRSNVWRIGGVWRIGDFGMHQLARRLFTKEGSVTLTPQFFPPEIFQRKSANRKKTEDDHHHHHPKKMLNARKPPRKPPRKRRMSTHTPPSRSSSSRRRSDVGSIPPRNLRANHRNRGSSFRKKTSVVLGKEDVYAFGILMFECFEKKSAFSEAWKSFSRRNQNPLAFARYIHEAKLELDFLKTPELLRELIGNCTMTDPEERISILEVVRRLVLIKSHVASADEWYSLNLFSGEVASLTYPRDHSVPASLLYDVCLLTDKQKLFLEFCNIGEDEERELSRGLQFNQSLTDVFLGNNRITGRYLGRALAFNKKIDALFLMSNKIDDRCLASLSRWLSHNSTLKTLDLSSNAFTDIGVLEFACMLKSNSTLRSVDLSRNAISDDGAVYLCLSLQPTTGTSRLKLLNLRHTKIQRPMQIRKHLRGVVCRVQMDEEGVF